jgi:hypothetical protein
MEAVMIRAATSSVLAFLLTLLMLAGAAPAVAQGGPHYRAEPAAPRANATLIVRDAVWKCGTAGCLAGKGSSRPETECAALARQVGELVSFSVAGRPLDAEALQKCNARAR